MYDVLDSELLFSTEHRGQSIFDVSFRYLFPFNFTIFFFKTLNDRCRDKLFREIAGKQKIKCHILKVLVLHIGHIWRKGPFNNYVVMRGERGSKNVCFCPRSSCPRSYWMPPNVSLLFSIWPNLEARAEILAIHGYIFGKLKTT